MKLAFIVNQQTPDAKVVSDLLEGKGYTVLKTLVADEIDQAGKQATKVLLVFDDAKFAYKFCGENNWGAQFDSLKILFLGKKPIMNADISQKLTSVGLKLFSYGDEEKLQKTIDEFETQANPLDDLQFSIIDDLEKDS